ncbi:SIMPL domain-containing protein [Streptomyces sp. NPDC005017]|uniref:SIMPL domain-containing protein n=1 Tax=Streptomyces sp. NPDC005017 TaxID=3364706 RepID=UPI003675F185
MTATSQRTRKDRPVCPPTAPARTTAALAVILLALGLPAAAAPAATALPEPTPAPAAAAPHASTVTVTGEGSATTEPDLAVVGAGVESVAETPRAALDAQSEAATALLRAARGQGITEGDIRTESVSLTPVYEYQEGTSQLKGYQASQSFTLKVRDVDRTGAVLQAVTDATGTAGRIHSVAFDVADPGPLRARARQAAYEDAHTKAEQYARLGGRSLGRLVSLTEDTTSTPRPFPPAADAPDGTTVGVPIAPGEIRATSTVTAVYELE